MVEIIDFDAHLNQKCHRSGSIQNSSMLPLPTTPSPQKNPTMWNGWGPPSPTMGSPALANNNVAGDGCVNPVDIMPPPAGFKKLEKQRKQKTHGYVKIKKTPQPTIPTNPLLDLSMTAPPPVSVTLNYPYAGDEPHDIEITHLDMPSQVQDSENLEDFKSLIDGMYDKYIDHATVATKWGQSPVENCNDDEVVYLL